MTVAQKPGRGRSRSRSRGPIAPNAFTRRSGLGPRPRSGEDGESPEVVSLGNRDPLAPAPPDRFSMNHLQTRHSVLLLHHAVHHDHR